MRPRRALGGRDALVLALLAGAFTAGLWRTRERAGSSTFLLRPVAEPRGEAPRFETQFVSLRPKTLTHAACLVELGGGRVRAFWYVGSREGATDVEVHTAVFDPASGGWSDEKAVVGPAETQQALLRYVRKVGNPAAVRGRDGTLWLFYVTVAVGGWGGGSISVVTSPDDGETWSPPRRLVSSPFLNTGTLVRGEPFLYADGTVGLPAYQSLPRNLPLLLRVDRHGAVIDRQRLSDDPESPQPVVLLRGPTSALALTRSSGPEQRVGAVSTLDAGRSWTPLRRLPLRNPDAALGGLVRPAGQILVALNDVELDRDALSLVASDDGGLTWRTVRRLEDETATRRLPVDDARYDRTVEALARATDARVQDARPWVVSSRRFMCWEPRCHFEFSYPFLLQTRAGEFHLVYTWNRAYLKHVRFNHAWLDEQPAGTGPHAPRD
ncbi:MAG TPA: sialidase family protein [Vicinamibacteria bacterium]|nr:sialidase family protein [Vicinamibacteria bacterium]